MLMVSLEIWCYYSIVSLGLFYCSCVCSIDLDLLLQYKALEEEGWSVGEKDWRRASVCCMPRTTSQRGLYAVCSSRLLWDLCGQLANEEMPNVQSANRWNVEVAFIALRLNQYCNTVSFLCFRFRFDSTIGAGVPSPRNICCVSSRCIWCFAC